LTAAIPVQEGCKPIRKIAVPLAKTAVTVTILYLILSHIEIGKISQTLQSASLTGLALCGLLTLPMAALDALRWQSVLKALGYSISFGSAFTYAICALFFGNLAPAFFGIDAFRATQMYRQGFPASVSIRAVLADRIAAFFALMIVIGLGLPLIALIVDNWIQLALFACVWIAGTVGLLSIVLVDVGKQYLPQIYDWFLIKHLSRLSAAVKTVLLSRKELIARVMGFGVAIHLMRAFVVYCLALALGFEVQLWVILAIVPVSLLVAMVPISLADWGIREAVFIVTLGLSGLIPEQAFTLSVFFGLYRIWGGVVGGVFWLVSKNHHYALSLDQTTADDPANTAVAPPSADKASQSLHTAEPGRSPAAGSP